MDRRDPVSLRRVKDQLVVTMATVLILCVPVYSNAGTNQSHPHAMLQLVLEATGAIPPHHHTSDAVDDETPQQRDPDSRNTAAKLHRSGGSVALGNSDERASTHNDPAAEPADSPDISPASPASKLIGTAVVPRTVDSIPLDIPGSLTVTDVADLPSSISVQPDPPPPRLQTIDQ